MIVPQTMPVSLRIKFKFYSLKRRIEDFEWPRIRIPAQVAPALSMVSLAVLVVLAGKALVEIPKSQVNELTVLVLRKDEVRLFELENEARRTMAQIVLGAGGLVALFLAWRRVKANDRNVEVMMQSQITDRYTKAIEQLGKTENGLPNVEVRLGGIYALERIAIDSARDCQTIMEVLAAYVRRNARRMQSPSILEAIPIEIQAVLTVLGKVHALDHHSPDFSINLRRTCLVNALLNGADLRHAYLGFSDLDSAALPNANLERAFLPSASLRRALLIGANLSHAELGMADLSNALLSRANLTGARLVGCKLSNADISQACLVDVQLDQAVLRGSTLAGADLRRARLTCADLESADLTDCNLAEADLTSAKLRGAKIEAAQLLNALGVDKAELDSELRSRLEHLRQSGG